MEIKFSKKLSFFTKYLISSKHSLNMMVWLIAIIVLPLLLYNYGSNTIEREYLIESKHFEYDSNQENKYRFNVINIDSEKETLFVSEENYNLCMINNSFYKNEPTWISHFIIGISFVWFFIFCASSFKIE